MRKIIAVLILTAAGLGCQAGGLLNGLAKELSNILRPDEEIRLETYSHPDYTVSYPSVWKAEPFGDEKVDFSLKDSDYMTYDICVSTRKLASKASIDTLMKGFQNEILKTKRDIKSLGSGEYIYSTEFEAVAGRRFSLLYTDGRDVIVTYVVILQCDGGYQIMSYTAKKDYFTKFSEHAKYIMDHVVYREGYLIDNPAPVQVQAQPQDRGQDQNRRGAAQNGGDSQRNDPRYYPNQNNKSSDQRQNPSKGGTAFAGF